MTRKELVRHVAFVLRCSAAATGSYLLAQAVWLPHPVWAAMSGIIVSQEDLSQTHNATVGRLAGTVIGVVIAVSVGHLLVPLHAGVAIQMAVAVVLAAVVARKYPLVRVCMWTCPIVFLSSDSATPLMWVGIFRGLEVVLGGFVGALLHWVSEIVISVVTGEQQPADEELVTELNLED